LDSLIAFVMTRCPICRFRYGTRTTRPPGALARIFCVSEFECKSCNLPYHALTFFAKPDSIPPGRRGH